MEQEEMPGCMGESAGSIFFDQMRELVGIVILKLKNTAYSADSTPESPKKISLQAQAAYILMILPPLRERTFIS
jgi:hypothetical protein